MNHPVFVCCKGKSFATSVFFFIYLLGFKMPADARLHNEQIPLFEPHVTTFICEVEALKVPPADAEADEWFHQARVMESPEISSELRDYAKIVQLTRQSADRHHWKAMLNLASLYIENRVPGRGTEDAKQTVADHASLPGYWQPAPVHDDESTCRVLEHTPPRPYRAGEQFATLFVKADGRDKPLENVLWRHFHTLRHNHGAIEPIAVPGLTPEIPRRDAVLTAHSEQMCPATGIWQSWISVDHPMHAIVNQSWRQAWVHEGTTFPDPETDWLLALPAADVSWYLLDDSGIDIG
jgi:hypothetical protein